MPMNEWSVVLVISALLGMGVIICKPVVSLTQAITRLTSTAQQLDEKIDDINSKNHDSHKRLWDHNEEQDAQLVEHDKRISRLEDKK